MPGNFKKEDLRVLKTHMYLRNALETLLDKKNFKQITVNDLCEEALISRAAFYSHFRDKYDLLEYWLSELVKKYVKLDAEIVLEELVFKSAKWVKNIIYEADNETYAIVQAFTVSISEELFVDKGTNKTGNEYIVFSNFLAGGLIRFLLWQIDNGYPCGMQKMKKYLNSLLENLIDWDAKTRLEKD